MSDPLPIADDIEMSDFNAMGTPSLSDQFDDRKRICTERSSSESLDTLSLSQVSSALVSSDENIKKTAASGIQDFKPTQLEIIEEGEFIWEVPNYLETGLSPIFNIGGTPWRINYTVNEKANGSKSVGLFLAVADASEREDKDWAVCAEFILGICNPCPQTKPDVSPAVSTSSSTFSNIFLKGSSASSLKPAAAANNKELNNGHSNSSFHRFCADECDWGFSQFCSINAFTNGISEFNVAPLGTPEGATRVIAKVRVVKDCTGVLWHNFANYDSKNVTGYVGLLNQGATCYMNSFVQSIFLTNEFRSAVYKIPTENVSPTGSIPLALQRIFYKLQTSLTPPSTTEMTKSFGWDTADSFMQHDVQEFSRVLMDDLENKMKGTEVEGTVERLFRGKLKNVLKCINVNYESNREESFYDLQLTIKGVKDLKESFERYVAAEMLCGDNQYRTDDFGLQDAKKFVTFEHFPPVLHIHLERYAFDMMAEATVKIHDRFEFPVEIALDPYLSETSPDRETSQTYWLHSVLVHAGDGHGGHYFVYIRHPSKPDCWYKFDDTKVTPCSQREAVDENFGGCEAVSSEEAHELQRSTGVRPYRYKKYTSAYLLVYIRKCDLDTVLAPVEPSSIPEYLVERIKSDDMAEARRRHERQQQYLSMNVTVLTEQALRTYSGSDLCDPDSNENNFRLKRDSLLSEVCQEIIEATGNDFDENCDGIECYSLVCRRNKTIRTDALIEDIDSKTVGSLNSRVSNNPSILFIRLTDSSADPETDLWRVPMSSDKVLIFFKWYNPIDDTLMVIGSMPLSRDQEISTVIPLIGSRLKRLGIDYEGDYSFYEEFKPSRIVEIDPSKTLKEADLRHGDIILIEPLNQNSDGRTVVEYFSDLLSWRQVDVKPVNPHQCQSTLENVKISTKWTLNQLCKFIADRLDLNWEHLRIAFKSDSNCVPADSPIELINDENVRTEKIKFLRTDNEGTVKDFLIGTSAVDVITIQYEITSEPARLAENQVRYFVEPNNPSSTNAIVPTAIYLTPYVSTVGDLIKVACPNVTDMKHFRLLEVVNGKIKRTFAVGTANESLTPIEPEKCSLYLEEVESGEMPQKLISCFTFEKNPAKPFGIPFKIELKPDETVKSLKSRLAQRLSTTSDFSLFLFSGNRDRKLDDPTEVLANIPGGKFTDEDHLAIMMLDSRKQRSSSGFDGAIRFRKQD